MIEPNRRERFRLHLARWGIPILALLIPMQFAANVAVAFIGYADVRSENDRQDVADTEFASVQDDLSATVSAIEEQRATGKVSSCAQAFDFATAHNSFVRRTQALLAAILAGAESEEGRQFLTEQIAGYENEIVRVRDCSPEGIEAFSNGTGGYLP